jgi:hypothetical protein
MASPGNASSDSIQAACQAALREDSTQVAKHLQSTRTIPSSIDAKLLPTSKVCQELLDRLTSDDPLPQCNVDHALRALFLIPPCYETAWRAVVVLIESLHTKSGWLGLSTNALFAGIADVQTFLQQTISSWWRQEGAALGNRQSGDLLESTPRDWLIRIAQLAMQPLQDENAAVSASDNRHWVLPLDLVATIVSFCQELEGASSATSSTIIDLLFSEAILKPRMLPLLSLAHDLQPRLRDLDRQKLHSLLKEALESGNIPSSDLPGIARSIISISGQNQEWRLLLLHLLHAASSDMATYSTVETVVQSSFSSQSTQTLYEWHSVEPTESLPSWILANYHLLLFQAARQSGSQVVSRLLSNALGKDDKAYNILDLCGQSLVHLCVSSSTRDRQKYDIKSLQRLLSGVKYEGEGKFSRRNRPIKELELTVLVQSLYLGSTKLEHRMQKLSAAERAQAWIHAANSMLAKPDFASKTTAILIIVAVFCDVPASRSTLVRSMVGEGKSLDHVDCVIIGLLVRSLTSQSDLEVLEPISNHFSSKSLPFDIFKQLADAFTLAASGRGAILSFCQKNLYASNAPWWAMTESRGSAERKEALQSALYGLCTLLVKWDDVGWHAWKMLSDFLVLNKPSLPVIIRSWLYRELLDFVQQNRFPPSATDHLLRALITRLLSYFDWVNGELKFIPQRAVAFFAGSQEAIIKEDLSSLFGVVIELTLKSASDDCENHTDFEKCRAQLQSICSGQLNATIELDTNVNTSFYYGVVSSLLASSVSFISGQVNRNKTVSSRISIAPSLMTLIELIAKEEKTSYSTAVTSARERIPEWLSGASDTRSCGKDVEPPQALYASICDLINHFLSRAFTRLDKEMQSALVLSVSNVYHHRRKLDSSKQTGLFGLPTYAQRVSPETMSLFSDVITRMFKDEQTKLEDLALILTALETACDDVSSLALSAVDNRTQSDEMTALFGAVALLYHGVASENPIAQLFRYLESSCSQRQPDGKNTDGLLGINCAADADNVVHAFRTKVLQAVADCINAVSKDCIGKFAAMDVSFLQVTQHLEIEGTDAFVFISQMLEPMTKDLHKGLKFQSGGITLRIYNLFLEVIETASILIRQAVPLSREYQLIDDSINAASSVINEILFNVTIASPLFKRTIRIAAVLLPSVHRGLILRSFNLKSKTNRSPTTFFAQASKQVLKILKDKASNEPIVWSEPSGTNQILQEEDDGEDISSDDDYDKNGDGIPLEIAIPRGLVGPSTPQNSDTIKLASEVAWTHALNSLLSAIDSNFCEASLFLQHRENMGSTSGSNLLECSGYLTWRKEEITFCMEMLCRCLKQVGTGSEPDNSDQRVLAQFLPIASKVKFLVMLDKLVLILTKLLRLLMLSIQKGWKFSSQSIAEVVSFVVAWTSNEHFDVIAGARRWFQAEKLSSKTNTDTQREMDKILIRLPKTMFRVDELESILQKLDAALTTWKTKESPQRNRLEQVEGAMMQALDNDAAQQGFSFAKAVKDCLNSATASRTEGYEYAFLQNSGRKRNRLDAFAKRIRRERKQPVPRSRNRVVDILLQVDRADDDAFVDMEDFLVEG